MLHDVNKKVILFCTYREVSSHELEINNNFSGNCPDFFFFFFFLYQVDMRGFTEFQHWVCFPGWDPDQNPDLPDFRAEL